MANEINSSQRVVVLIDGANVLSTGNNLGVRVDYSKVLEKVNSRQVLRCVFYHVEVDAERERPFLWRMREMGFEIKTKKLKRYADGGSKADQDVDVAVGAISMADKCDVITLVSSDGDFSVLLEYLKSRGIKTEVIAFEQQVSHELKEAADVFYPITEDMFLPVPPQKR